MATKKTKHNDIVEEQRRAREEFLKLKKMQSGEMDTGPKPSEVAIVPKTFGEKMQNIWFHDKWYIIGTVIILILISIMVAQCASREKYDLEIAIFSHHYVSEANVPAIEKYFEKFGKDIDGNGEVNIRVINCSFNDKSNNLQNKMAMSQKMTSIIAADANALLFITDSGGYEHLNNISEESKMFENDPTPLKDDFYKSCQVDNELNLLPEGLQLSCRDIDSKAISKDKHIEEYYKASKNILAETAKNNK